MHRSRWSLTAVLALTPALAAQQPQPVRPATNPPAPLQLAAPPAPAVILDPAKNRLDYHLLEWEKRMKGVESLTATCVRTETDPVTNQQEVYQGQAKFLRPGRATLYMVKKSAPSIYETYVCTGTALYEYRAQAKVVRIHTLTPQADGQPLDDNFLGFLFGMKAEQAKRRYTLTLAKEDTNYIYLLVKPNFPDDKAEFSEARIALFNGTYMPREVIFRQPSGTEVNWSIPNIDPNARLTPADFNPPKPPSDWKVEQVRPAGPALAPASQLPPSKVRPSGG